MFKVIKALFFRELKTRFGETKLGYFWVVLEPAVHLAFIMVLFSFIRKSMIPQVPFELFLLTGMLPYFLFRKIVFFVMDGAKQNKNLFSYKPVKPMDVYISRAILETLIYTVIFLGFLFILGWFFKMPVIPADFLGVVNAMFLIIFFGFSLGLCFAIIIHFYAPFRIVIQNIFKPMYFISGIMYPLWILPQPYLEYLSYNPILQLIDIFRQSYFDNYPRLESINIYYPIGASVVLLYIGLWFYHKKRFELGVAV
ncbi:capsular polysaccharide export system, inner membrane protein [Campylobacter iguaniorum]|uniref:ABC transporter permease n=1 Tax=Campylobacter iguaniorum TaxID=1244531 RepID=UPI0007C98C3A|nr:ABC transporter permease [Campylobacter iguaniorum]ANE35944.1 capsular polysaccharide export system, inner membrane protein [Campylobacter iguaniorum]